MSATELIHNLAARARIASRTLSVATTAQRREALTNIADALISRSAEVIAANEEDMKRGSIRDYLAPIHFAKWTRSQTNYRAIWSNWHGL